MFRFMKHCLPETYFKFRNGLNQGTGSSSSGNSSKDNAALRFIKNISKKFVKGNSGQRGAFSRTFSVLPFAQDDEKLIEVFDVLIKTQNRLVIEDPKAQGDIHSSKDYIDLAESVLNRANYDHRMDKSDDEEDDEDRPVYDMESTQTRLYDPRH